mgnify:FL=1
METNLNDLEGLRIAMDIEGRGYHFYQGAYDRFKEDKVRAIFKMLRDEEAVHLDTFTHYFEEIGATKEAYETEYLFDPEVSGYLTVLAEARVFPAKEETATVLAGINDPKDALELALEAEKNSVLFYDELSECSKFEQARQVFEKLKKEEQLHVVKIARQLQQLI